MGGEPEGTEHQESDGVGGEGGGWENTKQNSCKQAKMSGKKFLQTETEEKKILQKEFDH